MRRKLETQRALIYYTLALFCLFIAVPAKAADCAAGPLGEFSSLDMTPVPGGAGMSVPVTVNGVTKNFLVATAEGSTTLTQKAGETLGLHSFYSGRLRMLDANGYASQHYFYPMVVHIGSLHGESMYLITTPNPSFGQDPPLDGVLAADLMARYDVEIDFAQRKFNVFSQNHCPGQVVYWPASTVGVTPIQLIYRAQDEARMNTGGVHVESAVEPDGEAMDISQFSPALQGVDVRTTVLLDGKSFTANINTGLATSTLNSETARAVYDVTKDSSGSVPVKAPVNGQTASVSETVIVNGVSVFEHTFHTLTIGGVTVTDPRFTVRPNTTGSHDLNNRYFTGSLVMRIDDIPQPEVTIGMDILSQLHLYFAFKEGKLYITPADPTPATHS